MQMKMVTNLLAAALLLSGACAVEAAQKNTGKQQSLVQVLANDSRVRVGAGIVGIGLALKYAHGKVYGTDADAKESEALIQEAQRTRSQSQAYERVLPNSPAVVAAIRAHEKNLAKITAQECQTIETRLAKRAKGVASAKANAEAVFGDFLPDDFEEAMKKKAAKLDSADQQSLARLKGAFPQPQDDSGKERKSSS